MISRRALFTGSISLAAAFALGKPSVYASASMTIPGAIRWDAWYSDGEVNRLNTKRLSVWRHRAPWFAEVLDNDMFYINGNRPEKFDLEIKFAARAGLKYWAYCWYEPDDPMMNAWKLHQHSEIRDEMNWCLILQFSRLGGAKKFQAKVADYIGYFQQRNYQKVVNGRPLVYLYIDHPWHLRLDWGDDLTNLTSSIDYLRSQMNSIGLARPYIVMMCGSSIVAADYARATSSDAISNYCAGTGRGEPLPWKVWERSIQRFWKEMASTGLPIVPICETGWDTRPSREGSGAAPQSVYVMAPTQEELAEHIQAAVDYIVSNPEICPSKSLLIYSWNECSEGGNALIPTYKQGGATTENVETLSRVQF